MKNNECTIYISTKRGGYTQKYRKVKDKWTQTSPDGTVRTLTAEQLLSHILPPLAGVSRALVDVVPDEEDGS